MPRIGGHPQTIAAVKKAMKGQEPLSVRVSFRLTQKMWERLTEARGEVEVGDYLRSLLESELNYPSQE
jgi:hypothetical protein